MAPDMVEVKLGCQALVLHLAAHQRQRQQRKSQVSELAFGRCSRANVPQHQRHSHQPSPGCLRKSHQPLDL